MPNSNILGQQNDKIGTNEDDFEAKLDRLREIARSFLGDLEDLKQIAHNIQSATEEMGSAKGSAIAAIKQAKGTAIAEINEVANRAQSSHSQSQNADNPNFQTSQRTTTDAPAQPTQPNHP